MLEIILMLLGLAFPNSNLSSQTKHSQTLQTEITTQSDAVGRIGGETGGNNGQNPPK